ncbi:MAG TPA: hypothetical protein VFZ25_06780 [Chloroflexota bacterium]|nr:hypothetical protein [Chloroflexota bacterium]
MKLWMDRFEIEHDNLRAALRFFRENDATGGLRLADSLYRFWFDRGHLVEGQRWLEAFLESTREDPLARGAALLALGFLRHGRGGTTGVVPLLEEGLALVRPGGPSRRLVDGLWFMGTTVRIEGDNARARLLYEESFVVARATGELDLLGVAIGCLGELALVEGHVEEAREHFEESLVLFRAAESARGINWILRCLAGLAVLGGDDRRARELHVESLVLARDTGLSNGISATLINLGVLAYRTGDHRRAIRLIAAAARDSLPVPYRRGQGKERESTLASCLGALGEEGFAAAWAEGQAMTLARCVAYALEGANEGQTAD